MTDNASTNEPTGGNPEDTGQISVAELLARNGQQVQSRGGRRRRGHAGGISVAELTGEFPAVADTAVRNRRAAPDPDEDETPQVAEPEAAAPEQASPAPAPAAPAAAPSPAPAAPPPAPAAPAPVAEHTQAIPALQRAVQAKADADRRAVAEKAAQDKAAQEMLAREAAEREKAAQQKAARDKAARDKAAQDKAAQENAGRDNAAQQRRAQRKAPTGTIRIPSAAQLSAAQASPAQPPTAQSPTVQPSTVQPASAAEQTVIVPKTAAQQAPSTKAPAEPPRTEAMKVQPRTEAMKIDLPKASAKKSAPKSGRASAYTGTPEKSEPTLLSGPSVAAELMRQSSGARSESLDEALAQVHTTGEFPRVVDSGKNARNSDAATSEDTAKDGSRAAEGEKDTATAEPTSRTGAVRQWAILAGQAVVAVVAGALLFKGFEKLWDSLPWVALVLAVLVIAGLVAVVRILRQTEDLLSLLIAVIVGVLVTIGPLLFVLGSS